MCLLAFIFNESFKIIKSCFKINSFVIYFQQMFDSCAYFYTPTYSGHMKCYHLEGAVIRKSPRKPGLLHWCILKTWCRETERAWAGVRRWDATEQATGLTVDLEEGRVRGIFSDWLAYPQDPRVIQPGQESILGWWAFAGLLFVKLFQGLNQKLFLATWTNVLEEVRIHCPIRWIAGYRV